MNRPRVVIDTNILVSAALKPLGLEARVVELVAMRVVELCISAEVLGEYRGVLGRPKFSSVDARTIGRLLALVRSEATVIEATEDLALSPDEDDNRFYECAAGAGAEFIVTGNRRHFPRDWPGMQVVTARELLDSLELDG